MKYISLFSGIGGFDLGFDKAGFECVLQVEKNEKARAVLAKHWPNVPRMELVEDVTRDSIRRLGIETVDLLAGGFPCQDLSVAGQRKGLAGERSGLWFEFIRVIKEIRPQWVVIENVPGLLSSDKGRDMGTILGGLGQCGYWWAYRVLDAQYFGVPQRRRRVFIVASLRKFAPQEILFERDSSPWDTPPGREAGQRVAQTAIRLAQTSSNGWGIKEDGTTGTLDQAGGDAVLITANTYGGHKRKDRPEGGFYTRLEDTAKTLDPSGLNPNAQQGGVLITWDNGQGDPNGDEAGLAYALNGQANQGVAFGGNNTGGAIDVAAALNAHGSKRYDFESETFIAATLNSGGNGGGFRTEPGEHLVPVMAPTLSADDNDAQGNHLVAYKRRGGFGWSQSTNLSPTLESEGGTHQGGPERVPVIDNVAGVRRLTPLECERLQGFPDGHTEGQSDSARYRQLGNAVAVPVAAWIAQRIAKTEAL